MSHKELSNDDLLKLFKYAAQDLLRCNDEHVKTYFLEVEAEVLERMER